MSNIFNKPDIAVSAEQGKIRKLGGEIGIFILVFLIGSLIAGIVPAIYDVIVMFTNEDTLNRIEEVLIGNGDTIGGMMDIVMDMSDGMYIITLFCTVFVILTVFVYCRAIEKRSFYSMGVSKKNMGRDYLIGLLSGLVVFSACIGAATLFGGIKFYGVNSAAAPLRILLFAIGFGIQGFSEEITFRGYFMISIMKKNSVIKAVMINSLAFAIAHILNPGLSVIAFANLMLIGILMSLYVIKTNNIWGAAAFHSMWNFAQGIIYGISVSGTNSSSNIFITGNVGPKLINGGQFGLEGGIFTTVIAVACIAVIAMPEYLKKKENAVS